MKDAEFCMELNNQDDRMNHPEYSKIPEETSSSRLNNKLAKGEYYEKKTSGILRWHLE
jgi:sensor histidine kinase regulating citrate/malate metabolism